MARAERPLEEGDGPLLGFAWHLDPTSLGDTFMLRQHISHNCLVSLHENGRATLFRCTFDFHDQWWHFVQRT